MNYPSPYVSLIDLKQLLKCEMLGSYSGVAEETVSGMRRRVAGRSVLDGSKDSSAFIFRAHQSKKASESFKMSHCTPSDVALYPGRLESSVEMFSSALHIVENGVKCFSGAVEGLPLSLIVRRLCRHGVPAARRHKVAVCYLETPAWHRTHCYVACGCSLQSIVTRLLAGSPGFDSWWLQQILIFSKTSRPAFGPNQPRV